jgi:hypothetical protein
MSIKFSSSTNSNNSGITSGGGCSEFCGVFSCKFCRKFISICGREFKCEWSGIDIITIIVNFIVLTIFFPIVIVIWGIVLIREQFRWIKRKFLRIKIGK